MQYLKNATSQYLYNMWKTKKEDVIVREYIVYPEEGINQPENISYDDISQMEEDKMWNALNVTYFNTVKNLKIVIPNLEDFEDYLYLNKTELFNYEYYYYLSEILHYKCLDSFDIEADNLLDLNFSNIIKYLAKSEIIKIEKGITQFQDASKSLEILSINAKNGFFENESLEITRKKIIHQANIGFNILNNFKKYLPFFPYTYMLADLDYTLSKRKLSWSFYSNQNPTLIRQYNGDLKDISELDDEIALNSLAAQFKIMETVISNFFDYKNSGLNYYNIKYIELDEPIYIPYYIISNNTLLCEEVFSTKYVLYISDFSLSYFASKREDYVYSSFKDNIQYENSFHYSFNRLTIDILSNQKIRVSINTVKKYIKDNVEPIDVARNNDTKISFCNNDTIYKCKNFLLENNKLDVKILNKENYIENKNANNFFPYAVNIINDIYYRLGECAKYRNDDHEKHIDLLVSIVFNFQTFLEILLEIEYDIKKKFIEIYYCHILFLNTEFVSIADRFFELYRDGTYKPDDDNFYNIKDGYSVIKKYMKKFSETPEILTEEDQLIVYSKQNSKINFIFLCIICACTKYMAPFMKFISNKSIVRKIYDMMIASLPYSDNVLSIISFDDKFIKDYINNSNRFIYSQLYIILDSVENSNILENIYNYFNLNKKYIESPATIRFREQMLEMYDEYFGKPIVSYKSNLDKSNDLKKYIFGYDGMFTEIKDEFYLFIEYYIVIVNYLPANIKNEIFSFNKMENVPKTFNNDLNGARRKISNDNRIFRDKYLDFSDKIITDNREFFETKKREYGNVETYKMEIEEYKIAVKKLKDAKSDIAEQLRSFEDLYETEKEEKERLIDELEKLENQASNTSNGKGNKGSNNFNNIIEEEDDDVINEDDADEEDFDTKDLIRKYNRIARNNNKIKKIYESNKIKYGKIRERKQKLVLEYNELVDQYENLNSDFERCELLTKNLEEENDKIKTENQNAIVDPNVQYKLENLENENGILQNRNDEIKLQLYNLEGDNIKLKNENRKYDFDYKTLYNNYEKILIENANLEQTINKLEGELEIVTQNYEQIKDILKNKLQESRNLKIELEKDSKIIEDLENTIQNLGKVDSTNDNSNYEEQIKILTDNQEDIGRQLEKTENELFSNKNKLKDAKMKLKEANEKLKVAEKKLQTPNVSTNNFKRAPGIRKQI